MLGQPELHQLHFILLVGDDLLRQPFQLLIFAVQQDRFGHVDRALMVWNHHGDEVAVMLAGIRRALRASHSSITHQLIECPIDRSGEFRRRGMQWHGGCR